MMPSHYILDKDGRIKRASALTWGIWFEKSENRIVKQEQFGDVMVSTVFLGLDHNFSGKGPPILWETMVFGGPLNQEMNRCSGNREQAEAMHDEMVQRVKDALYTAG
jgi:hypothetical protein